MTNNIAQSQETFAQRNAKNEHFAELGYKINEGGTAYLMILGGYGTDSASNNYIINPDLGEIKINLANYANGFYTVALVVNGQIIDAKTLIKQ